LGVAGVVRARARGRRTAGGGAARDAVRAGGVSGEAGAAARIASDRFSAAAQTVADRDGPGPAPPDAVPPGPFRATDCVPTSWLVHPGSAPTPRPTGTRLAPSSRLRPGRLRPAPSSHETRAVREPEVRNDAQDHVPGRAGHRYGESNGIASAGAAALDAVRGAG